MQLFSSKKPDKDQNWYNDRNNELISQRKILIYLNLGCLILLVALAFLVAKLVDARQFDPFVIKIDENTGSTTIVRPITQETIDSQESLNRYFIKKYLIAREGYNAADYANYSRMILMSYSSGNVYEQYRGYIRNAANDLAAKYGSGNSTYLTIKSWSKLGPKKYIVRFAVSETSGNLETTNKVAVMEIDYRAKNVNEAEMDINPVGFTVVSYSVTQDQG